MAFANSVTIGPEFFKKALNDYANAEWAIVREFMQNCMDAKGSDLIIVDVIEGSPNVLVVQNNGEPMSPDILVNKLLALGGSGKNFEGTVGGFGKAKEALYFAHKAYEIDSGASRVVGSGAGYDLSDRPHFHGTTSRVELADSVNVASLLSSLKLFISLAQWPGTIVLNGERYRPDLRKGSPRREFEFGKVYTNKTFDRLMVVRINGVPMFYDSIENKRCVVVELNGTSGTVLTANRDGLVYPYRSSLHRFVQELAVDKRSALRESRSRYRHYQGPKLRHEAVAVNAVDIVGDVSDFVSVSSDTEEVQQETSAEVRVAAAAFTQSESMARDAVVSVESARSTILGESFIVKNNTELEVPRFYLPEGAEFSSYCRRLARTWGRCLLQLHRVLNLDGQFSIGFIFDEDETLAEHEDGDFGQVYYISPAKLVKQRSSNSRSWQNRYKPYEQRFDILSTAAHEVVHGAFGIGGHSEDFASVQTEVMGKVMQNLRLFNHCFK